MCLREHTWRMRGGSSVWPQIKMQDKGPSFRKGDQQSGDAGTCLPLGKRDAAKITLALMEQRMVFTIGRMCIHRRDTKPVETKCNILNTLKDVKIMTHWPLQSFRKQYFLPTVHSHPQKSFKG